MKNVKKFFISLIAISLLSNTAIGSNNLENKNRNDLSNKTQNSISDASYTIGFSIATNMMYELKKNHILVDPAKVEEGFVAGVKGNAPKLTQEQMEKSMKELQEKLEPQMEINEIDKSNTPNS